MRCFTSRVPTTTDLLEEGGNTPIPACVICCIRHKIAAIGRFMDRYGAYIGHLTSLSQNSSVRALDWQKLKGYLMKWQDTDIVG